MRKLLLFFFAAFCSAGFAGAQCASSFTFSANPQNNSLLNFSFNNTSSYGLPFTGQQKRYMLDYGDGNVIFMSNGTTAIPDHNYPSPGTYFVGLRIYSYDSATQTLICTDSTGRMITATYPSCGTTMTVAGTGGTRSFLASTPAGSTNMTYTWSFGDGGTSTGVSPSHTYATAGFYTVTLTAVRSNPACSYTNTRTIYISLPPAPLNCSSLVATFTTSVTGNVLTTTNTSSTVSTPPYVMVAQWTYGDGATATGMNPAPHTYSATGVYNVSLRMTWRDSFSTSICTDTETHQIAVLTIPAPANLISGQVRYDSVTYGINNFKVWLIKLDSASNTLYAVDSQITANTANAYYAFANKAAGIYRTKAAVYLGSTSGTGLVPTYHDSSAYWNTASLIYHNGGSSTGRNIYMRNGTLSAGPGFIGGNISLGANKGTANGVAGILVFLRNATTRIVSLTYTDAQGNYRFAGIPTGAYSIYPELINFACTPITPIVLTMGSDTVTSANFNYDEVRRSIAPTNPVSIIPECLAAPGVYITPIPAHDNLTINWVSASEGEARFFMTSYTGQTVAQTALLKGRSGVVTLNVSNLAPGIYFVRGTGVMQGSMTRVVVQ